MAGDRAHHPAAVRWQPESNLAMGVCEGQESAEALSQYRGAGCRKDPDVLWVGARLAAGVERIASADAHRVWARAFEELRSHVQERAGRGGRRVAPQCRPGGASTPGAADAR